VSGTTPTSPSWSLHEFLPLRGCKQASGVRGSVPDQRLHACLPAWVSSRVSSDDGKEREQLLALGAQLVALTEAYDRVVEDERAMEKASESFNSLLQVDSLEQADQKIDELAASGRLDPALLLMMAKAYAGSKETDATQEDVRLAAASCWGCCAVLCCAVLCCATAHTVFRLAAGCLSAGMPDGTPAVCSVLLSPLCSR
jgi:hypothetical protein